MKLPSGYSMLRTQAPVKGIPYWWSSLVCVAEARCMLSIEETNRELIVGTLGILDHEAVDTIITEFTRVSGPIKCFNVTEYQFSNVLLVFAEYQLLGSMHCDYRLSTKVNNGRMQGTDMGVNGLQSIVGYLRLHRPSTDAYITVTSKE